MENASSMDLSRWVTAQVALLDPPSEWEPNAARARAEVAARMKSPLGWTRLWRVGAIAATSCLCVALLVSPHARVFAEQCWRCVAGGRTEVAPTIASNPRLAAPDFSL